MFKKSLKSSRAEKAVLEEIKQDGDILIRKNGYNKLTRKGSCLCPFSCPCDPCSVCNPCSVIYPCYPCSPCNPVSCATPCNPYFCTSLAGAIWAIVTFA